MVKKGTNVCVMLRKNILGGTVIKKSRTISEQIYFESKKSERACEIVRNSNFLYIHLIGKIFKALKV
jgi:hypothetical protein